MNLPKYKCHKTVEAMKISGVEIKEDGSAVIAVNTPTEGRPTIEAGPGWRERFKGGEADLGYYIRYEDGYESWPPTEAFENGYSLIEEGNEPRPE